MQIPTHSGSARAAPPIFNPDLEADTPQIVQTFAEQIAAAGGLIIASPEYVRTQPSGLKNAIDGLMSRPAIITKPIALTHASHRGDDMLKTRRSALTTVSQRFAPDIFLCVPLTGLAPDQIAAHLGTPAQKQAMFAYLSQFRSFIRARKRPHPKPGPQRLPTLSAREPSGSTVHHAKPTGGKAPQPHAPARYSS
ncbi:MAG: NAD(P)H-dependent oxidoreductase [Sideroxyarcus sp.]|nr:NAD(P)H-dependent oxidoreductase [Sideroxyarcus sp.]